MKKNLFIFLFTAICCFQLPLFSQIEILTFPYPENQLSYQDVWNFQAINPGKNAVVGLRIEIEEQQSGKMGEITTPDFLLASGTTVFNSVSEAASMAKAIYYNKKFENGFLLPSGAPSGKYRVCIYFTFKNGIEIIASKCMEHEIIQCPQTMLIYPADESVIAERNPLFSWAAANRMAADEKLSYSIHVKEIFANQSKEEAMRSNLEVFADKDVSNTMLLYPPSAFPLEIEKKYCWQIRSYINGELCNESEVWQFEFDEPQYKKDKPKKKDKSYATLSRELDGGYYPLTGDTLCFRWDGVYNRGNVIYKIYNSQNQSLTETMPVLERRPLDNLFDLDLSGITLANGYYVLEVMTEKNERWVLRFKK